MMKLVIDGGEWRAIMHCSQQSQRNMPIKTMIALEIPSSGVPMADFVDDLLVGGFMM